MKTTIRLPLGQFEFIEMTYEQEMTPEAAVEAFKGLKEAWKTSEENYSKVLPPKEWNTALDSYINGNPLSPDIYYAMSPEQQKIIQELKKCFKRIKSKNGEEPEIE